MDDMSRVGARLSTVSRSQLDSWRLVLGKPQQPPPRSVTKSEAPDYARALWCKAALNVGGSWPNEMSAVMNSAQAEAISAEIALMCSEETPGEVVRTFDNAVEQYRNSEFTEGECPTLIHNEKPGDGLYYAMALEASASGGLLRQGQ